MNTVAFVVVVTSAVSAIKFSAQLQWRLSEDTALKQKGNRTERPARWRSGTDPIKMNNRVFQV